MSGDEPVRIGDVVRSIRPEFDERGAVIRAAEMRDGAAIEDEAFAEQRRQGLDEARQALWLRRIPRRFHDATTGDFTPAVRVELDQWARAPQGRNLVLLGPVGVGKSRAAVAAARAAHFRGLDVAFWPTAELLDAMRPSAPAPVDVADVGDLDRLILDDVGVERSTDWAAERLDAVVNRRWMDDLPTIATTNLGPEQLAERVGERTYSRLVGGAVVIRLTGDDRRRRRPT